MIGVGTGLVKEAALKVADEVFTPWTYVATGAEAFNQLGGNVIPGLPVGWAAGQLAVADVCTSDVVLTVPTPSGWTAGPSATAAGAGGTFHLHTFWRVLQAGDAAPTFTADIGVAIGAVLVTYSGGDQSSPISVSGTPQMIANNNVTVTCPSITTTVANTTVLMIGGSIAFALAAGYSGTPTPTERADFNGEDYSGGPNIWIADFLQASPGATGARTATEGAGGARGGMQIGLNPLVT